MRYMTQTMRFLSELRDDERGVTSIEYGILAAGVAVVIGGLVASDGSFSTTLDKLFKGILDQLPQASAKKG